MDPAPIPTESELLANRREKLEKLKAAGINAFGGRFDTTHSLPALRENFAEALAVRAAGRITARRDMGKTQFFDNSKKRKGTYLLMQNGLWVRVFSTFFYGSVNVSVLGWRK